MEDQERERDPARKNYRTTQMISSVLKLPLAPLVSTAFDRRRDTATVPTRRGAAIFSPTRPLDGHQHDRTPPQISPHPPLLVHREPITPDPDQAPALTLSRPQALTESGFDDTSQIKYIECLKNHAASSGGHVLDGCGEFMSSGGDGTLEALRCAACDCHRSFHRREVTGDPPQPNIPLRGNPLLHHQEPSCQQKYHKNPPVIPLGGGNGGGAAAECYCEDLNILESSGGGHAVRQLRSKKRFRTKFSKEQKDRMQEFAAKMDWRIQKREDEELQSFCSEIGVKRQVFKVWMHNNKQALKRKLS